MEGFQEEGSWRLLLLLRFLKSEVFPNQHYIRFDLSKLPRSTDHGSNFSGFPMLVLRLH